MTREIKFRAWVTDHQAMHKSEDAGIDALVDWVSRYAGSALMQYTGLKDKNRVEIYEGDIVRFPTYPNTGSIVWADGFCGWAISDSELEHRISAYVIQRDVEVIGNIYENPALGTNGKEGDK